MSTHEGDLPQSADTPRDHLRALLRPGVWLAFFVAMVVLTTTEELDDVTVWRTFFLVLAIVCTVVQLLGDVRRSVLAVLADGRRNR